MRLGGCAFGRLEGWRHGSVGSMDACASTPPGPPRSFSHSPIRPHAITPIRAQGRLRGLERSRKIHQTERQSQPPVHPHREFRRRIRVLSRAREGAINPPRIHPGDMSLSVLDSFAVRMRVQNEHSHRNSSGSIACQIIVLKADVKPREQGAVSIDALAYSAAGLPHA